MNTKSVILKSENQTQISVTKSIEGISIQKIVMPISPLGFINLMHQADSKVNPRNEGNYGRWTQRICPMPIHSKCY